jgi:hypothetical protein
MAMVSVDFCAAFIVGWCGSIQLVILSHISFSEMISHFSRTIFSSPSLSSSLSLYEFTISPPNVSMDRYLAMVMRGVEGRCGHEGLHALDYPKFIQEIERKSKESSDRSGGGSGYSGLLALIGRFQSGLSGDTESIYPLPNMDIPNDPFSEILKILQSKGMEHSELREDEIQKYLSWMISE